MKARFIAAVIIMLPTWVLKLLPKSVPVKLELLYRNIDYYFEPEYAINYIENNVKTYLDLLLAEAFFPEKK